MPRRERELPELPTEPTFLPPTGAADATEARGHSPNCVRRGGGPKNSRERERERERGGDETRGGTHGSFHVSGESCWDGSRREAAQRAAGVSDHASITASPVGHAAKTSDEGNRAPLLTDFTAPIRLSSPSPLASTPTLPPCCTYAPSHSKTLAFPPSLRIHAQNI